jgi:IclR helix-turn-helix domain
VNSPQSAKKLETNVTRPGDKHTLATITAAYPDWRFWCTPSGDLAARKGGTQPTGPQARGATPAELLRAIQDAIRTGPSPALRTAEQAVLDTLKTSAEPLPTRAISDRCGLALSTTGTALARLHARGLVTRRRKGRAWTYTYSPETLRPGTPRSHPSPADDTPTC